MASIFARCGLLLTLILGSAGVALADTDIREQVLQLDAQGATLVKGRIKGRQTVDYRVPAMTGQAITVEFAPSNRSACFNLLPPATETAQFVGSTSGNRYEGALAVDGEYRIRLYLVRSAARRNETARYTLKVRLAAATRAPAFERDLSLQGITFHVSSANAGSVNAVRIAPAGLEIDNSVMEREIEGNVIGAEVADLDADGSPEVYVYVSSVGSGSYGSLVAFSANKRKSLSEITLPALDDTPAARGYEGHDEFAVLEGVLGRRYPLYRIGNAAPSGRIRQVQYKLVPGEANWTLKVDRIVEY